MPQIATKLFRKPEDAEEALAELKSSGYRAEGLGVLVAEGSDSKRFVSKDAPKTEVVTLPGVGAVVAIGAAATVLGGAANRDPESALTESWSVTEETIDYYRFGISLGGVVVSVDAEGSDFAKAAGILRAASKSESDCKAGYASSPGFAAASRMSATNPIDAPMSGDFQK
ncbi:hypothetical protein ACFLU2_02075 [Chloroflexota bacterium]